MKSKLISVNNLKVSSEHKKLVKGISFDLNRNEILGIIGESGSGKSLTALSILSLIKFKGLNQSGEIFYACLLYTSPSPRDTDLSRMPSSA